MYLRCSNAHDEQYTIVKVEQKDLAIQQFATVEERQGTLPEYRFTTLY